MSTLRKTIRKILLESAVLADEQAIAVMKKEDLIFVVSMLAPYEGTIALLRRKYYDIENDDYNLSDAVGQIQLGSAGEETMQVSFSELYRQFRNKGLGKLLYNVALMACTDENVWLMSDRNDVSSKAQRIWQTWSKLPELYDIEQMDHDMIGDDYFLTDDEDDDMVQNSFNNDQWRPVSPRIERLPDEAYTSHEMSDGRFFTVEKDSWFFYDPDYKKQYLDSGLTKRFQMKDAYALSSYLEQEGLLYYSYEGPAS
tara:strand:- start:1231 stop:1995 length:765 start_codon:yes stop_codon:yes gene_type:complete